MPRPAVGEVLVRVEAAGVNFADLLMVEGRYQVRPPPPFVAGQEVAGVVVGVSPEVPDWQIGARVMGAPAAGGGFAEYIALPAARLCAIPDGLDFAMASGLLVAHGTAYFGLKMRGALRAGEWVVVTGAAGGVGLAAVQIAARLGARVIAACGSDEKCEAARAHGADAAVNYASGDLGTAIKDIAANGFDLLFDNVGGAIFDSALRAAAPEARLLIVGFAGGAIPQIPANRLLLKNLSAVGVGFGALMGRAPQRVRKVVSELAAMHRTAPFASTVEECLPLDSVPEALTRLALRRSTGKLCIMPGLSATTPKVADGQIHDTPPTEV
jgi:NADPH2:quinone reductase